MHVLALLHYNYSYSTSTYSASHQLTLMAYIKILIMSNHVA